MEIISDYRVYITIQKFETYWSFWCMQRYIIIKHLSIIGVWIVDFFREKYFL